MHVLSTTLVAAEHYEHGTFWPKLGQLIDHEMSANEQRIWGKQFLANLETLNMPTFEGSTDAGTRYVGRILLHGGIPSSDLHDFYRLIARRRQAEPGLSAEDFVEWAQQGVLPAPAPVKRLLRHGGEFAVDLVERTFELLDLVHRGADPSGASLPARFAEAAQVLAGEEDLGSPSGAGHGGGSRRPALVLQPYGQGLVLRLPPVSEAPDGRAVWLVGIDGDRQRVSTRAAWPGANEVAPSTDVTVGTPVRAVTAALESHAHLVATVPVLDDTFPLLGFSESGHRLPLGGVWRESLAWLLFPGPETDLDVEGALTVRHRSHLPPGWAGWSLVLADLTGANSVGLVGHTPRQRLRRRISAQLHLATPVAGVETDAGDPVWSELPEIELPEDGSDGEWEVAVLDAAGAPLTSCTYVGGGWATDIWDEVERPLLGKYTVRIRGPWGRGLTRDVTVIEGLEVSCTPRWRRFDGAGLVPATANIGAVATMTTSEQAVTYGPRDVRKRVRVSSGLRGRNLVIEPPHMSVMFQTEDVTLGPRTSPLVLAGEDLREKGGELVVLTGTEASPTLHYVADGAVAQRLVPRQQEGGTAHRVALGALGDTLVRHPVGRLCLDAEGVLEVASVRPRRLLSGVVMEGDELILHDAVDHPGLTAVLYSLTAPWLPPTGVAVVHGQATLPEHLRGAGSLLVLVKIEDPWFPEPMPAWPEPGRSYTVIAPGHVLAHGSETLASFLSDTPPEPAQLLSDREVRLEHLWVVLGRRFGLGLGARRGEVMHTVCKRLRSDPDAALRALSTSPLDAPQQIDALVVSGMVSVPMAGTSERGLRFDERSALPSMLRLSAVAQLGDWAEDWIGVCGDVAVDILQGRADPAVRAGRIDAQVDMYSRMQRDEREQLTAVLGLVPHGLLHPDTRVMAAMSLVDLATDEYLVPFFKKSAFMVKQAVELLETVGCSSLVPSIVERIHPDRPRGWRAGTAASLGLALTARLAAREVPAAVELTRVYGWALRALALNVPHLVRSDLVLAESLLRGWQHPESVLIESRYDDEHGGADD